MCWILFKWHWILQLTIKTVINGFVRKMEECMGTVSLELSGIFLKYLGKALKPSVFQITFRAKIGSGLMIS